MNHARAVDAPEMEDVDCDGCGGKDLRFRYRLDRSSLVSCRECGLTFVTPRWPGPVLAAKLQQWATLDTVDDDRLRIAFEPTTMQLYARYMQELTARLGRTGTLLDVGCATGAFLVAARGAGWEVQGLELGEASAAYARERQGLDVTCRSLYDFDPGPVRFDAIVWPRGCRAPAVAVDRAPHARGLAEPGRRDARGRKARLKAMLRRTGLLAVAYGALALQDRLLGLPGAPALGSRS